ncbi:voltage-dependent T-type calcium channel subunit alpha-1G-like [Agrilus planipennis]|uniref:Voltage-dependent T-type calcium channel subunit alpha-1G-like n=1 Tax=Agrilus planipennis TaxID=224129 RepID=A0A1W4XDJ8_AGRPL|nr:voltage-dependent T-type calcium channel subunit alpha-1G-like [Agrilus planipennis]XP_018330851.1 voltage-dependent T-type calcium channel subunit alpha-1G-like [Agrilus planipennis]XP_018330852.1 voltage-dependent T-type calcium channel subunit alpha-1G-like [Agrilus planipennis]XP_018330853.1 voltage-dependent T-type calcium channel subunit alpha-1G-like [Agrilus planipennis]
MPFYGGSTYLYCRSESESGLGQRRISIRDIEPTDSGDSTLTDIDESESGSGSGQTEINPNIPYPGIAPIALGYLSQTTRPRSWCLALISNPYPFHTTMLLHIHLYVYKCYT